MDAKTAQSVFGAIVQSKKQTTKEETTISFKSANDSLVKKNLLLKQQLAQCTKTIEKLRNENVTLREKNQSLVDATLEQKIEIIVEERLRSRLAHAAVLNRKLVQNIQQTGLQLSEIFKDLEPDASGLISRRQPKLEACLEKVDESPIRQFFSENYSQENENVVESASLPSATTSSSQIYENGTPRKTVPKGRRSELFQISHEGIPSTEKPHTASAVPRRCPLLIAPSATPGGSSKTLPRKAPTPRFKKPSTPVSAQNTNDSDVSSTVRRQRSAKMNIKSLKEPSIRDKLRQPGKHDEPMPFINSFF